jgi:hypothetical protein
MSSYQEDIDEIARLAAVAEASQSKEDAKALVEAIAAAVIRECVRRALKEVLPATGGYVRGPNIPLTGLDNRLNPGIL